MSKTKAKVASKRKLERIMVVYGLDQNKKPRAAKFAEHEFELARKAAELMKLNVFEGEVTKPRQVVKKLSPGRIFASGEGFVPNIPRNQYDKLVSLLGTAESKAPEPLPPASLPSSCGSIKVGDLVLGQADSAADGWWEAIVESVEDDMLRLQARDFPDAPRVVRHRSAVALLHTADYVAPDCGNGVARGLPVSWDSLALDHLVIAQEENAEDGWWEAVIVEIENDTITLRWRDYPKQPKVTRHRTAVALLDPTPPQSA
jgi:hypothetical protein